MVNGVACIWRARSGGVISTVMDQHRSDSRIHPRLTDTLYVEAMVLADEARSYFDDAGREDRDALSPMMRVTFSCESLKVTTRLMHAVAWLLTQRAVDAGELVRADVCDPLPRLGDMPVTDLRTLAFLPVRARGLVEASIDLYRRVARHDAALAGSPVIESPARSMQDRLAMAF